MKRALLSRARGALVRPAKVARDGVLASAPGRVAWWRRAFDPWDRVEILKPIPVHRFDSARIAAASARPVPPYALVATAFDEAASAERWVASVAAQTLAPTEIVVQDGGSRDGTPERLEAAARALSLPLRVLRADAPLNIAAGRNRAIAAASAEIVLVTDLGCALPPCWCHDLVAPFRERDDVDLAAGSYVAAPSGDPAVARVLAPGEEGIDAARFLPSSRSIAFRKQVWRDAGGYPEWLTLTGEDTLFDVKARRASRAWAYVPSARVVWQAPRRRRDLVRVAYRYGLGDGEAGLEALANGYRRGEALRRALSVALLPLAAPLLAARALGPRGARALAMTAMTKGLLDGRRRRVRRLAEAGRVAGCALVLSGVPISDSGGGQRGAQLALALVGRGFAVTYVNAYPSFESPRPVFLDADVERLELRALEDFDVEAWLRDNAPACGAALALLEFPHPRFVPIARRLRRAGIRVVYDCIDEWKSSLGWIWYSERAERRVLELADVVTASARTLVARTTAMTAKPVRYLPQAVNAAAFPRAGAAPPRDLPPGDGPLVLYVGSLWGSWFDWELVRATAERLPGARLVFIGEYRGECPHPLPNLHFLGLKAHADLAGYLAAARVCTIPFKVDAITRAVNPLKVYEYLAMGKPVVASMMPELEGLPYVTRAEDPAAFARAVEAALATQVDPAVVDAFTASNRWERRVDDLLRWSAVSPLTWR